MEKVVRRAPRQVQVSYVAWKRIIELQGPMGLLAIRGFRDEALRGEWKGFRSSRLGIQWRVIYQAHKDECSVYVIDVNPHVY